MAERRLKESREIDGIDAIVDSVAAAYGYESLKEEHKTVPFCNMCIQLSKALSTHVLLALEDIVDSDFVALPSLKICNRLKHDAQ